MKSKVVSLRTFLNGPNAQCQLHSHPFFEFTLVSDGDTTIWHGERKVTANPHSFFLFSPGEKHRFQNTSQQTFRTWVLHFQPGPELAGMKLIREPRTERRQIQLSEAEAAEFKRIFVRIHLEHISGGRWSATTETAWLTLMLTSLDRMLDHNRQDAEISLGGDPGLLRLWEWIQEAAHHSEHTAGSLSDLIPGYEGLRHRFRKHFGMSPREMLIRSRMSLARHLLLETTLSIKQIAAQVGYHRQHEFWRAFRKATGVSPSDWRENPLPDDARPRGQPHETAKGLTNTAKDKTGRPG
jgi:AraC family transcriptional regulator